MDKGRVMITTCLRINSKLSLKNNFFHGSSQKYFFVDHSMLKIIFRYTAPFLIFILLLNLLYFNKKPYYFKYLLFFYKCHKITFF